MLRKWIGGDARTTIFCVGISAASLLLSLLGIPAGRKLDPAWIAVVLCGVPIVAGAASALVREHDIKADLLSPWRSSRPSASDRILRPVRWRGSCSWALCWRTSPQRRRGRGSGRSSP